MYDYKVTQLVKVVDGDTYDLTVEKELDFGFQFHPTMRWTARFRLKDADTPERGEENYNQAIDFSRTWITHRLDRGVLRGTTFKPTTPMPDGAFGRWLIDLYDEQTTERLSNALKSAGLSL